MAWKRIMVPLAGTAGDAEALGAGRIAAEAFGAELAAVHVPADIADLMPWMGEGFMGGVQVSAVDRLKEAAEEGGVVARAAVHACGYPQAVFVDLASPVWAGLALQARLSEAVVFDQRAACGRGPLSEAFQQIVADEQRPVIVARGGLRFDTIALAWDGGKEATRAARKAVPMLQKATRVVVFGAPAASSRRFALEDLQAFLAARGVKAQTQVIEGHSDAGHLLLAAAREAQADVLVAGAFGHTRLREYIFGGTTRTLLNSDGPSLFLSH